jgi:mannosyltransferase OCH1-like enzyme
MSLEIPKVINFFWANEKMSWLRYISIWTAKKFNPEWEVRLYLHACEEKYEISEGPWTHENIVQDFFNYEGENFLEKLQEIDVKIINWQPRILNKTSGSMSEAMQMDEPFVPKDSTPPQRGDYFKWYLMATEGGFYSDNDILFVKSMDDLYEQYRFKANLISYDMDDKYFSVGFLASSGKSNFYKDIYIEALKLYTVGNYQQAGVVALNLSLGHQIKPN